MGRIDYRCSFILLSLSFEATALEVLDWIASEGGWISPKLQVRSTEHGGRGLFIVENASASETLLSVPFNSMLTAQEAMKRVPCRKEIRRFFEEDSGLTEPERTRTHGILSMMVYILSKWNVRTDLPVHIQDMLKHWDEEALSRFPLFWSSELRRVIDGTSASDSFAVAEQGVAREFNLLMNVCPQVASKSSLKEYSKVWALVNSRVLKLPGSDSKAGKGPFQSQNALIPAFDLVNHNLPPPSTMLTTDLDINRHLAQSLGRYGLKAPDGGPVMPKHGKKSPRKLLHLWTSRAVGAGMEITDVYGILTNEDSLWRSGFTVPWIHNLTCLSSTIITLQISDLPGASTSTQPGLGPNDLVDKLDSFLRFRCHWCPDSSDGATNISRLEDVLSFTRIWIASAKASSPEALTLSCGLQVPMRARKLFQSFGITVKAGERWHLSSYCKYLKPSDEVKALMAVSSALNARMSRLQGGSLQDDEAILSSNFSLGQSLRDAIVLRRDEKYVLQHLGQWLKDKIKTIKREPPKLLLESEL